MQNEPTKSPSPAQYGLQPNSLPCKSTATALAYLHDKHHAHFVLCQGKRAIWPGWQRRRPGIDTALAHPGSLGVIPASLGTTAADVDYGDVGVFIEATGPLVTLASPKGHHCYFQDDKVRPNGKWRAHGCSGEIRSGKGYLILYEGGPDRLVSALQHTPAGSTAWPSDLFGAAGIDPERALPIEGPRVFVVRPPANLKHLADAEIGARNDTLFDHLRFWAYGQDKGIDVVLWSARALRIARTMNLSIPDSLRDGEVEALAWSVASWTFNGGGPIDHTRPAQRRRGIKSGKVRRGLAVGREVYKPEIAARDAAIIEAVASGKFTQAEIAVANGCLQQTVALVIQRDAPLLRPRSLAETRPWEAEGVSRATWFRRRRQGP